jgi:hypothetical protein
MTVMGRKRTFGRPSAGTLKISARTWAKLVSKANQAGISGVPPAPPISARSIAIGYLVQWLALTGFFATFFFLASRDAPPDQELSLAFIFGFPAIAFAILLLVQFFRQR